MKAILLPLYAVLAFIVVSCGTSAEDRMPVPGTAEVMLSFTQEGYSTKAGVGAQILPGEADINSLYYYVFDADGRLESTGSLADGFPVRLDLKVGRKTFWALANVAGSVFDGCRSLAEFENREISMDMYSSGNFPMGGVVLEDVSGEHDMVVVPLSRYVCRLCVDDIRVALSGTLEGEEMTVGNVFLSNVVGNCKVSGAYPSETEWYNKFGRPDGEGEDGRICGPDDSSFPEMTFATGAGAYLYFFPNPSGSDACGWKPAFSSRYTRIVVEAYLRGIRYYYPVNLNGALRNHAYSLRMTITRPGSTDPDTFRFGTGQEITVIPAGFEDGESVLDVIY